MKEAKPASPHWLLAAIYGRDLLKAKLRQSRPDLVVPEWKHAAHLDTLLELMVDELGLRDMPEPKTMGEKVRYLKTVALMALSVKDGHALTAWETA